MTRSRSASTASKGSASAGGSAGSWPRTHPGSCGEDTGCCSTPSEVVGDPVDERVAVLAELLGRHSGERNDLASRTRRRVLSSASAGAGRAGTSGGGGSRRWAGRWRPAGLRPATARPGDGWAAPAGTPGHGCRDQLGPPAGQPARSRSPRAPRGPPSLARSSSPGSQWPPIWSHRPILGCSVNRARVEGRVEHQRAPGQMAVAAGSPHRVRVAGQMTEQLRAAAVLVVVGGRPGAATGSSPSGGERRRARAGSLGMAGAGAPIRPIVKGLISRAGGCNLDPPSSRRELWASGRFGGGTTRGHWCEH